MTDSATFATPEADEDEELDLSDLLLEVLPGDGSTIGNLTAREALSRAAERQISEEEYAVVKDRLVGLGLILKGQGRGGTVRLAEGSQSNILTIIDLRLKPQVSKEIPTQEEVQSRLDSLNTNGPRQIVKSNPRRYKRGAENTNRIWINVKCSEHGLYPLETRLDQIIKTGTKCRECGQRRTTFSSRRTHQQIENAVKQWAKARGFPVRLISISDDHKTTHLECKLHGLKERSTDKVVDRGQLCDQCVDQSGQNSPNYISFQEKVRLYGERYNPPLVKLVSEESGSILYRCLLCNKEYRSTWSNIFHQGIKSCRDCSHQNREHIDVEVILGRLAEFGVDIVDKSDYKGTHHHTRYQCRRCNTIKLLKANNIFGNQGISCRCTRSIPDLCHDLISNNIIRLGHDVGTEYKLEDGKTNADIFVRDLNTIVEVKYGDSPLGRSNGTGQSKERYLHTKDQLERYLKSGYKIIYAFIADEDKVQLPFEFPSNVEVVYLKGKERMEDHDLFSDSTLISELSELYWRPYKVRDFQEVASLDKEKTRNNLKEYLVRNDFIYPNQGSISSELGISQRKMDNALGLGRHSSMQARIDACKYWFGIDASTERRIYMSKDPGDTGREKLIEILRGYLTVNNGIYPSKKDWAEKSSSQYSSLDYALGVSTNETEQRRIRCGEIFDMHVVFKSENYLHKTPEAQKVRDSLRDYLIKNNLQFPKRRMIKSLFGVGWMALDAYLGLDKPVSQEMRIKSCRQWFVLEVK